MKVLVLKTNNELFIDVTRLGSGVYTKELSTLLSDKITLEDIQQITNASDETMNYIKFNTYHVVEDYLMKTIIDTLKKESPNLSNILREMFEIVE